MTIDISIIPAERLALLDTATLFRGAHLGGGKGPGDPDCEHCARELAAEVVTGRHEDKRPAGVSLVLDQMPNANDDGRWRDDEHRTNVLRPYLRKILMLDPAKDEARIYTLIDRAYRQTMPDICDALKLDKHGSAFRDLAPIVDRSTTKAAIALARDLAIDLALDPDLDLAIARDPDLARAIGLARALARDLVIDVALARDFALGLARDLAIASAIGLARAIDVTRARDLAIDVTRARDLVIDVALARDLARDLALDPDLAIDLAIDRDLDPAEECERYWRGFFDLMCSI